MFINLNSLPGRNCTESPDAPENGFKICSDADFLRSECHYWCDDGYKLEGSLITTCENVGGGIDDWSQPAPKCVRQ